MNTIDSVCRGVIGIQDNGASHDPVYKLAERLVVSWGLSRSASVLDLGGGAGSFSATLLSQFTQVHLMDFAPVARDGRIRYATGDLNDRLPYTDATFDAVAALEVIEHLENPRAFVREIARILKPGGRCLLTTPNQTSLTSKVCLLLRDEFQHFQASSYPAHITALLPIDLKRVATEAGLTFAGLYYTDDGRIPGTVRRWQALPFLTGKWFSDNLAVVALKP